MLWSVVYGCTDGTEVDGGGDWKWLCTLRVQSRSVPSTCLKIYKCCMQPINYMSVGSFVEV